MSRSSDQGVKCKSRMIGLQTAHQNIKMHLFWLNNGKTWILLILVNKTSNFPDVNEIEKQSNRHIHIAFVKIFYNVTLTYIKRSLLLIMRSMISLKQFPAYM